MSGIEPTARPAQAARLRALDVLRGVAIVLVLGRHMPPTPLSLPRPIVATLELWRQSGWVGVDLFFVLSGFLVSGLLFREYQRRGEVDVTRFLVRRGFKIYPAFYVFLLVTAIYTRHTPWGLDRFAAESFFLQGYLPHIWPHTWSLAVEEHFYLLLALLTALLVRRTRSAERDPFRVLILAIPCIATIELAIRIATVGIDPTELYQHIYPTHLRLDSLSVGVLLAYWYHVRNARLSGFVRSNRAMIAFVSAAALAPCLILDVADPFMETVGLTLLAVGFAGVMLLALLGQSSGRVSTRRTMGFLGPLAWLGTYSYSVYLWHFAVARWSPHILDRLFRWRPAPITLLLLYFICAVLVGVGMAKLIELPFLALRDRWFASRSIDLQTAAWVDPLPRQVDSTVA